MRVVKSLVTSNHSIYKVFPKIFSSYFRDMIKKLTFSVKSFVKVKGTKQKYFRSL